MLYFIAISVSDRRSAEGRMEIKVICQCGTKYKFDVQPVDGHMPQAVKCPACGAPGTAQANAAIQEALGIPAAATEVPPPPQAAPVPQPGRLRISAQHAAPAPVPIASAASGHGYTGNALSAGSNPVWKERGKKVLLLAGKGLILLLCLGAMLIGFGGKKGKRVRFAAKLISAVFRSDADTEEYKGPWNLWGQDIVLLLVRHTNETEVAQACTSFWQDNYKKKITFVSTNDLDFEENEIGIIPAHNGCVQIVGGLTWLIQDFEKLTQQLSEKFNTVAIATRDVDFSGAYVFSVFEGGEKKFRAEMQIKGKTLQDMEETVTVEGEAWAREHGYKPGEEGFNEFLLADGDLITQRLGFKLWDREEWDRCLVMTEMTNAPPARAAAVPSRTAKAR